MIIPERDNAERNYTHYVNKLNYNLITEAKESVSNDVSASDKAKYFDDAISETHKVHIEVLGQSCPVTCTSTQRGVRIYGTKHHEYDVR